MFNDDLGCDFEAFTKLREDNKKMREEIDLLIDMNKFLINKIEKIQEIIE